MTSFSQRLLDRAAEMGPDGCLLLDISEGVRQRLNPDRVLLCDFCGRRLPSRYVSFGCRDFVRALPGEHGRPDLLVDLQGDWLACEPCARLVDAEAWGKLAARAMAARRPSSGHVCRQRREVARAEKASLFLQAHGHFTGERTEVAA